MTKKIMCFVIATTLVAIGSVAVLYVLSRLEDYKNDHLGLEEQECCF